MQALARRPAASLRRPAPAPYSQRLPFRRASALLVSLALACSSAGSSRHGKSASAKKPSGEVLSYRLPLRDNSVDPGAAFRCYGHCQSETNPKAYLACLSDCPGFVMTPGEACDEHDVPPVVACLTVRKVPKTESVDPSLIVGVIGSFVLVVGMASLCASSHSQCGGEYYPPPH